MPVPHGDAGVLCGSKARADPVAIVEGDAAGDAPGSGAEPGGVIGGIVQAGVATASAVATSNRANFIGGKGEGGEPPSMINDFVV